MQFLIVATPNHMHFPVAAAALTHGFHVLCDKPATLDLAQALRLREVVAASARLFGLTYTYSGYPLVKHARQLVASGRLGRIRNVQVEYLQGWLADTIEATGNVQASWRVDPQRAGAGGALGDLGVHALHIAEYVSGLQVRELCADLASFGAGRVLDDDGSVLIRLESGARGQITFSQICVGELNGLKLRVYGERGSLEWDQRRADELIVRLSGEPAQTLHAGLGAPMLSTAATTYTRLPPGHPEGYIEAFANIYRAFANAIRAADRHETIDYTALDVAGIDMGVRGMAFIEQSVASARSSAKWLPLLP